MTYAEREKERLRRRNEARRGQPSKMTPEQRERRRQYDRDRKRAVPKAAPSAPCMTVDEFLAQGNRIEVLPGLKQSSTYARRRPITQFRGEQA